MKDTIVQDWPSSRDRKTTFKPILFGRYCLIDRISQGGMSDVYLAKTFGIGGFQKPLIIKRLLPQYSTKARYVKRFLNEAKTLTRLNHSNIVQIFDMGRIDGEYYIALEYIEGRNVAYLLAKAKRIGRPVPMEFALHIALGVAQGLSYAHQRKGINGANLMLVHQDVNSFNVMVSYEAEVKIIDFGIARIFLDNSPVEGFPVAGKLLYFSPEQLQNKSIDRRVDIYGTGVLLYELLTGERLIEHQETVSQTVRTILEMDIHEKVDKNETIPSELKSPLIQAMALNPDDRYSWIEDFIVDLGKVMQQRGLNMDLSSFSKYMRDNFRREIVLDSRRMRKLLTYRPVEGWPAASRDAGAVGAGPSHETLSIRKLVDTALSGEKVASESLAFGEISLEPLTFPAGKAIYLKGDPATHIYLIQKGKVRVWLEVGRVKKTLALPGVGDYFGEAVLLGDNYRFESAEAEEDCIVIPLDQQTFEKLVGDKIALRVVLNILSRLREVKSVVESDLLGDSLSRLIYGLLFFHRRSSHTSDQGIDLSELADLLRLENKEQIMKYLKKLEEVEIVRINENMVHINDARKLENMLKALSGRGKLMLKV